uniref:Uncharacterized protein n=1 Tax=Neobodo designis TaxID=312471 RepID=A0A7S1PRK8_NEODS|mmetsp:Transcript_16813/g.52204  ORF Transcript_16813/g.52204 Transcript_16813/m.52204 type:complete len:462 (+) Transcript_16813:39-1424(+)
MLAPGLFADASAMSVRVFLGQSPALKVDAMLTRQMQPVFAWYTSRPRANEQGSLFLNLDGASCDTEVLARYCHTFYVRRALHQDQLDRQLSVLESGKPAKEANAGVLQALDDVASAASDRCAYEERRMAAAKQRATVPFRRELDPSAPLESWDILPMMRCVAEDETAVDVEGRARAFLPVAHVDEGLRNAQRLLLGKDPLPLDKKDVKSLARQTPGDYEKVGTVAKLRPIDVTSRARFTGEKAAAVVTDDPFTQQLWGHVFRRYATHPQFLQHISAYWPVASGMVSKAPVAAMPADLADAACRQQLLFPGHGMRLQHMYSSPQFAKQVWRTDKYVPMPRLLPLLGHTCAEDLLAGLLVDGWWAANVDALGADANPLDDGVVRAVRAFVTEHSRLHGDNLDVLLARAVDAAKTAIPPLTEEEASWKPKEMEAVRSDDDAVARLDDSDEGSSAEAVALPNETL